jgi:Fic family protein
MRRDNFTPQAPGSLVEITDERGNRGLAFLPKALPPSMDFGSKRLRIALSVADRELARLDGQAKLLEEPASLFGSALKREALLSSKIEGTRTTLADLALFDLVKRPDNDSLAVANYVEAYDYSRVRSREVHVGSTLLCEVHGMLMRHDSEQANAGRLRTQTVLIGNPPLAQARFVPPPWNFVRDLMENLEQYLANDDEPPLIKLAIAHYQFEAIHPFCDGNGRVGRILISAWLEARDILTAPMLYISAYFQQHQNEYYDRLLRVSTHGEWEEWILFFLDAVATQSRDSVLRAKRLADLRRSYHHRVDEAKGRSHYTHVLIDALFRSSIMSVPRARSLTKITYAAAKAHVVRLVEFGILEREPFVYKGVGYYFPDELIAAVEGPMEEPG